MSNMQDQLTALIEGMLYILLYGKWFNPTSKKQDYSMEHCCYVMFHSSFIQHGYRKCKTCAQVLCQHLSKRTATIKKMEREQSEKEKLNIGCGRDLYINGLCTENCPLSQQTLTPYKIKVNLVDLAIRIELTQANLMPQFSRFLRNLNIHFQVFTFGTMFPESQFDCYAGYKLYQRYMFQFIPT